MCRIKRPDRLARVGGDLDPPPLGGALDAPRREELVLDEPAELRKDVSARPEEAEGRTKAAP